MSHRIDFFRLWGRLRWSRSRMNRRRPFLTELLRSYSIRPFCLLVCVRTTTTKKITIRERSVLRGPRVETNTVVTRPQGASVKRCVFCFRPPPLGRDSTGKGPNNDAMNVFPCHVFPALSTSTPPRLDPCDAEKKYSVYGRACQTRPFSFYTLLTF